MSQAARPPEAGHLGYYKAHGISPVRYEMSDVDAHFDRRDSLYRGLGLPPIAFKGCQVLEVAPGSGQNSLYVASAMPSLYELVEPNPTAIADITALYAEGSRTGTAPILHRLRLEDFAPERRYDVIICENWLGGLAHERAHLRKLAALLVPGGVLVITIVPLTGFFPNVIRKLLALRLVDQRASFAEQTDFLTETFGPHLATISGMTRSHRHWVQDCLLNPHYLNVALPLDAVIDEIGATTEILASVPRIANDWRWFKQLVGKTRDFNETFYRNYLENLHNLVDYRRELAPRPAAENAALERICRELHDAALVWQSANGTGGGSDSASSTRILAALDGLAIELDRVDGGFGKAVAEARDAWGTPHLGATQVSTMQNFGPLFGRETLYLSCTALR